MDNYGFCVEWVLAHRRGPDVRVLDYGCGAGAIVAALRDRGVDAYGCDVFYEGGDTSSQVAPGLLGAVVRRIDADGRVPFADGSFDLVVSNQVIEHVVDLDAVLREIDRVLAPGGRVLSLFPDRDMWREAHCGIPFMHWFPKGSRPRVYYAAALRLVGLGHHTEGKSALQWSADFAEWLDRWTSYRSRAEVFAAFRAHFDDVGDIGETWLRRRLDRFRPLAAGMPSVAARFVARKLGGCAIVCTKRAAARQPRSRAVPAQTADATDRADAATCERCGSTNAATARFCGGCGAPTAAGATGDSRGAPSIQPVLRGLAGRPSPAGVAAIATPIGAHGSPSVVRAPALPQRPPGRGFGYRPRVGGSGPAAAPSTERPVVAADDATVPTAAGLDTRADAPIAAVPPAPYRRRRPMLAILALLVVAGGAALLAGRDDMPPTPRRDDAGAAPGTGMTVLDSRAPPAATQPVIEGHAGSASASAIIGDERAASPPTQAAPATNATPIGAEAPAAPIASPAPTTFPPASSSADTPVTTSNAPPIATGAPPAAASAGFAAATAPPAVAADGPSNRAVRPTATPSALRPSAPLPAARADAPVSATSRPAALRAPPPAARDGGATTITPASPAASLPAAARACTPEMRALSLCTATLGDTRASSSPADVQHGTSPSAAKEDRAVDAPSE